MTVSLDNIYIICTSCAYSGTSGDTDNVYLDKGEADAACKELNDRPAIYSVKLQYFVQSVYDYMQDKISDAEFQDRR